jgi:hypothetical protein
LQAVWISSKIQKRKCGRKGIGEVRLRGAPVRFLSGLFSRQPSRGGTASAVKGITQLQPTIRTDLAATAAENLLQIDVTTSQC